MIKATKKNVRELHTKKKTLCLPQPGLYYVLASENAFDDQLEFVFLERRMRTILRPEINAGDLIYPDKTHIKPQSFDELWECFLQ